MINLILTLSLFNATQAAVPAATVVPTPLHTAQVKTCVWPNVCKSAPAAEAVAQVRPCVWPNVCKNEAAAPILVIAPVEVAQFTTCVYPRKCRTNA